ncbi:MAG: thioredoxin family protein [Vicinamibacterales bacterium]
MTLTIYVSAGCWTCDGVGDVIAAVSAELPDLTVQVVDVDRAMPGEVPEIVFSIPTYTLNGQVVSLGNPAADFVDRLRACLDDSSAHQECGR